MLVLIGITCVLIATSTWWNTEDAALIAGEIRSGHGYEGVDEYQPTGDDRTALPNATPDAEELPNVPATPRVEVFDPDSGKLSPANADLKIDMQQWTGHREHFAVETGAPVTLALRLLSYPAWDVQVDGKNVRLELRPKQQRCCCRSTRAA